MWQNNDCLRFVEYKEVTHVWKGHEQEADDIWEHFLESLESWFNSTCTDPDIQHIILEYLRGWRNDTAVETSHRFLFDELLCSQEDIGWKCF